MAPTAEKALRKTGSGYESPVGQDACLCGDSFEQVLGRDLNAVERRMAEWSQGEAALFGDGGVMASLKPYEQEGHRARRDGGGGARGT